MNPAASLLGPLYDLNVAAFGASIGGVASYLTLGGIVALVWWAVSNHQSIISGLDLRAATIWNWLKVLFVGALLYFVSIGTFGFPFLGAVTVAVCSAWLYQWTMTNFEGETV